MVCWSLVVHTLPETNIASENRPSQKEIHLPSIFRGFVSFREGIFFRVAFSVFKSAGWFNPFDSYKLCRLENESPIWTQPTNQLIESFQNTPRGWEDDEYLWEKYGLHGWNKKPVISKQSSKHCIRGNNSHWNLPKLPFGANFAGRVDVLKKTF